MADGEVAAGYIWTQELANIKIDQEIIEENDTKKTITRYTPLGVCVGIVPWNCESNIPNILRAITNPRLKSQFTWLSAKLHQLLSLETA